MKRTEFLVLGGGLTGLVAAWRLQAGGRNDLMVLERDKRPGGLLKTYRSGSAAIDHLPHVFFSKDRQAGAVFREMVGRVHKHKHRLGVLWKEGFVDFPFQNHVHQLDLDDRRRVLEGLLRARELRPGSPRNLEDLALGALGSGIVDLFFRPYNEKLWQTRLADMDYRWLAAKIRLPDAKELSASILGAPSLNRKAVAPHAAFLYPRRGGIESLVDGLVRRLGPRTVRCGSVVRGIDTTRRVVHTDAEEIGYRHLISTLPLDDLMRLSGLRHNVLALSRLRANRVVCIQYVLKAVNLPDRHWIYVPEPDLPFYRITRVDLINPAAAPGHKVILVECSLPRDGGRMDVDKAVNAATRSLVKRGVISAKAVVERRAFDFAPAYVIPHVEHGRDIPALLAVLRRAGIVSAGRFGSWDFFNMDHSIRDGFRAAAESARL